MKISVIIPVFNAEKFIRKAVESALDQSQTGEILLIDDASPDGSLSICQELEEKHDRVRLLRHDDLQNHGAGAARNLGIRNAKFDYVAFLDADDFYLKDRFTNASELFAKYPNIDGVYEATGVYYNDEQSKQKWISRGGNNLTTLKQKVPSNQLFEYLLNSNGGHLHLDGIVVKKILIDKCGYFFEHLKLHQDTALIYQMAEIGSLYPGNLHSPVAFRTIHNENRILDKYDRHHTKFLLFESLFFWALNHKLGHSKLVLLYLRYIYNFSKLVIKKGRHNQYNKISPKNLVFAILKHPYLFVNALAIHSNSKFRPKIKNGVG